MKKKEMKKELLDLRQRCAWLERIRDSLIEEADLSMKFIKKSALRYDEYKRFIQEEMKKKGELEV